MKFPLLPRKKNTDKSRYGHVLVVAGSKGMPGAAILASRAALKSGAGLVTLAAPENLGHLTVKSTPEIMPLLLPETKDGALSLKAYPKLLDFIAKRRINALGVGPGLSQNKETAGLVRRLVSKVKAPIVLDADGLNSFKGKAALLRHHGGPLVLTPHRKEFERIFTEKFPEKESNRARLAKKVSKFYDVVLVLKGHRTLVAHGAKIYINKTGNPGLAKGGSGDVLAGVIASFIAQGLDAFQAAVWAVHFHGKAADIAVRKKSELGLTASDVIEYLPRAFGSR